MLEKNELNVLKVLFSNFDRDMTIQSIARTLKQKYPQTHKTIYIMEKKRDVLLKEIGRYKIAKPDLTRCNIHYIIAEMEKAEDICKRQRIHAIRADLLTIKKNFVCILFGSQATENKPESDVDLLFIIPDEYDYGKFETLAHNTLLGNKKIDINIVPEKGMLEMWGNPKKFNVGNEILKEHIVLHGAEYFLDLLRQHYVG